MVIIVYYETGIIRNNKVIKNFDFCPNKDLDLYLRSHERSKGSDDWFSIANLTKDEVKKINDLDTEKVLAELKEGDTIDILLHFTIRING